MYLRECWKEGAWITHPSAGALIVTSSRLAISLLDPTEGFHQRPDLEKGYPGEGWKYHPQSPSLGRSAITKIE
jgi:hypothetical protein